MHVQHAVLVPDRVEFRGYQANLARIAAQKDTLVVLPTGLGKTIVALLAIADALRDGARRVLMLAPTKPLVEQHHQFFEHSVVAPWNAQVRLLTGHTPPAARQDQYKDPGIVCATPQVVANDIIAGRIELAAFDWIVFDEAHRAVGEYPYAFIGREARKAHPTIRRLGLTASPGHDARKIEEVRSHLGLDHVEIRTPQDPDVVPYIQDVAMEWETLPLPETMARVSKRLEEALAQRVRDLKQQGSLKGGGSRPSRRALLEVAQRLQVQARHRSDVPPEVYQALSVQAQAMKLLHAIELAQTQGSQPFIQFIDKMKEEARGPKPSKATRVLLADPLVNEAYHIARHDTSENPKMGRTEVLVQERLEEDPNSLTIVFANYRATVEAIRTRLAELPGVRPVVFVGQGRRGGRDGLTQVQQRQVLDAFRDGTHNVLVATSVAEEGLDVPATDLVVFYEPIPSEIRSIQRRGRTGRHREGRVVVLMTKGTQDEAAHWTARRKEQQMIQELLHLRRTLAPVQAAKVHQATLRGPGDDRAAADGTAVETTPVPVPAPASATPGPRILCDHREQAGGVVRHLHELGARIEGRNLEVADFVLSDRIAVERKECSDFVDSLIDGRLFDQIQVLQNYPKPFLLLEGDSLFGHRNVRPEAIMAALASVTVDHGVPVVQTRDALETARFLLAAAKREQFRGGRRIAVRPGKQGMTDAERLRFIVAGFPNIDEARATALLAAFGSLGAVFAADEDALAAVPGVGPATAREVRRLLEAPFVTETVSRGA